MIALSGPFYAAALLLAAAGAFKVLRPGPAARALAAMRVPAPPLAARLLGAVELAVAAAAFSGGRPGAVALAVTYGAFAVYALLAGRRAADCGCFGSTTPLGGVHVAVDAGLAAVAAAVAVEPLGAPREVLAATPLAGIPLTVLALVTAYLLYVTLTGYADLRSAQQAR